VSDLLDLRTVNATFTVGPCAEVRVGEHVIRYVRRGSGPCIVLLDADAEANPVWGPLVDSLAAGHRIVVPQPPSESVDDTSSWLRGFVEGLGLSSCVVIAGPALTNAALDLVADDDLLVRKLVLIGDGGATIGAPTSRILRVDPATAVAESVGRIEAFVANPP
jgi:hypothetical protein